MLVLANTFSINHCSKTRGDSTVVERTSCSVTTSSCEDRVEHLDPDVVSGNVRLSMMLTSGKVSPCDLPVCRLQPTRLWKGFLFFQSDELAVGFANSHGEEWRIERMV